MEVAIPAQAMDFDFNSARASPFLSAPSSPKRFGQHYFSSPNSPTHLSQFPYEFDDFYAMDSDIETGGSLAVPFDWEETPGTPKSSVVNAKDADDFAFDIVESKDTSRSAEELFDGGRIRPLKPPPQLHIGNGVDGSAIRKSKDRSPRYQDKKTLLGTLSPRQRKESNLFATAAERGHRITEYQRGRERVSGLSSSSSRRGARSLSPYRVSTYPWEEEEEQQRQSAKQSSPGPDHSSHSTTTALSSSSTKSCRKWRLVDFFLFRSKSEGRAADKDPLRKYTSSFKKHEDIKNSSFRSSEGSNSGSVSKRRGPVSAHEQHYKVNRAASEDLKKKTFLPYKHGFLGRLAFNPPVNAFSSGFR